MREGWWMDEPGYEDIKGIVHVGANDGYEIPFYLTKVENVIAIEPLPDKYKILEKRYQKKGVICLNYALGQENYEAKFNVVVEDDMQSSLLPIDDTMYAIPVTIQEITVPLRRFDSLGLDLSNYDCLVVDTQGTELDVLMGCGNTLQNFKHLIIELTDKETLPLVPFSTEITSDDVIEYLTREGFMQITPKCGHGDVAFTRKDIYENSLG